MPEVEWTETFEKAYKKLSPELKKILKKKIKKKIDLFANNPAHPSLRSKPIKGAPGIY